MSKEKLVLWGFFHAVSVVVYVGLVASVLSRGETLFGSVGKVVGTMGFLLLLVVSVALMGLTIFGRPILLYLDGERRQALTLVFYTLIFLVVLTAFLFLGVLLLQ